MEPKVQCRERNAESAERAREGSDLAALTGAMTKGEEMAWRVFHDEYFGRLWRYLLVVAAGNEDEALEAVQAALVRVARHIKVFTDEKVFWSWLTVLARTALADERKKKRRYSSFLDRFARHARLEPAPPAPEPAEERLGQLLERQLARLPEEERIFIEKKYIERLSVRQIANELNTTEKAVESKLSRIRQKLKDAALSELRNEPRT